MPLEVVPQPPHAFTQASSSPFLRVFLYISCVGEGGGYTMSHFTVSYNESICLCKVGPTWEDRRSLAFLMPSQALVRSPGPRWSESPHFKVRTRRLHSSLCKPDRTALPCSPALVNTEMSMFPLSSRPTASEAFGDLREPPDCFLRL